MAKWGTVMGVAEIRRIGKAGDIESWYRYTVTTAKGITFTEEVAEANTSAEILEPILKGKAERLDKALAL